MWRRNMLLVTGAGLATGVSDGLFACILSTVFYGSTVTRLWQGVAATVLGKAAFEGGIRTALIGVAMHFGVAFGWSAVLLALVALSSKVRRVLGSRNGSLKVAAVYGPTIWIIMSIIVIPLLLRRLPTFTVRWWIQGIGHIPFVGLPMAAVMRRFVANP